MNRRWSAIYPLITEARIINTQFTVESAVELRPFAAVLRYDQINPKGLPLVQLIVWNPSTRLVRFSMHFLTHAPCGVIVKNDQFRPDPYMVNLGKGHS